MRLSAFVEENSARTGKSTAEDAPPTTRTLTALELLPATADESGPMMVAETDVEPAGIAATLTVVEGATYPTCRTTRPVDPDAGEPVEYSPTLTCPATLETATCVDALNVPDTGSGLVAETTRTVLLPL